MVSRADERRAKPCLLPCERGNEIDAGLASKKEACIGDGRTHACQSCENAKTEGCHDSCFIRSRDRVILKECCWNRYDNGVGGKVEGINGTPSGILSTSIRLQ